MELKFRNSEPIYHLSLSLCQEAVNNQNWIRRSIRVLCRTCWRFLHRFNKPSWPKVWFLTMIIDCRIRIKFEKEAEPYNWTREVNTSRMFFILQMYIEMICIALFNDATLFWIQIRHQIFYMSFFLIDGNNNANILQILYYSRTSHQYCLIFISKLYDVFWKLN